MNRLMASAAVLMALATPAHAWTPEDCRPGLGTPASETKSLVRYCSALQRELIADDSGSYVLGRIEKAELVKDDPNSKFYYWVMSFDADAVGSSYFDSRSDIGKRILKVCVVNSVCALKVSIRKSWELNVGHATFWIAKVSEVTRVGRR